MKKTSVKLHHVYHVAMEIDDLMLHINLEKDIAIIILW